MCVNRAAVVRTVLLVLALVNQALVLFGWNPLPFEEATVSELVSLLFTLAAATAAWWKNNSFSKPARCADCFLAALKEGKLTGMEPQALAALLRQEKQK